MFFKTLRRYTTSDTTADSHTTNSFVKIIADNYKFLAVVGGVLTGNAAGTSYLISLHTNPLEARVEGLDNKMDVRIDGLDKRIDGLDKRIDGLEKKLDSLAVDLKELIRSIQPLQVKV